MTKKKKKEGNVMEMECTIVSYTCFGGEGGGGEFALGKCFGNHILRDSVDNYSINYTQ